MLVKNDDLKALAKSNGVFLYEVADRLNVSEPTLIRWLRHQLTPTKREQIVDAITNVAKDKATDVN